MKILIESLDAECSQSAEQRETFLKLKREIATAGHSLTPVKAD